MGRLEVLVTVAATYLSSPVPRGMILISQVWTLSTPEQEFGVHGPAKLTPHLQLLHDDGGADPHLAVGCHDEDETKQLKQRNRLSETVGNRMKRTTSVTALRPSAV